ncbi:MAG TPA: hypothetical protein VKU87_12550, partial [Thermomicrobiaceae bacterium]|nr:hypothetical protein [Thermomicrobiaceae bacterium]
YGGLAVGQNSTGGAQAQVASCTGLSGLAHTASTLNDSGSVDASVSSDGSYAISCGVKQGTTSLGVSYSGPDSNAVPFDLNVDTTPPTTTASYSNSYTPGTWTNQAVTVTLNASDNEGGSGVATTYYAIDNSSCTATTAGLASCSVYTTPFTISANGTHTLTFFSVDAAGNIEAAQSATIKIDTIAPTVTSPLADHAYIVNASVPLACADVGSGINTCQVTVKAPNGTATTVSQGQDVPTNQPGSYTVTPATVTDKAGNADTTSFTYTVDYALTTLPGSTTTVTQGYYAVIRFYPADANGHDEASRSLTVRSVELDGPNKQVMPFVYAFHYGTFSGKAGYQLEINTRNLSLGSWTLKLTIGSDTALIYSVSFTVS